MKKLVAVWMLMIAGSTFGQTASGDVIGTIVGGKNNQPIIGAKTLILDNGPNNLGDWYFTGDYPTPGGNKVVNKAFVNWMEKRNERAY